MSCCSRESVKVILHFWTAFDLHAFVDHFTNINCALHRSHDWNPCLWWGKRTLTVYIESKVCQQSTESARMSLLSSGPDGVLPPRIAEIASRSISLEWQPPVSPNGVITMYRIYQNKQLREEVSLVFFFISVSLIVNFCSLKQLTFLLYAKFCVCFLSLYFSIKSCKCWKQDVTTLHHLIHVSNRRVTVNTGLCLLIHWLAWYLHRAWPKL